MKNIDVALLFLGWVLIMLVLSALFNRIICAQKYGTEPREYATCVSEKRFPATEKAP